MSVTYARDVRMQCPHCGSVDHETKDTRHSAGAIWRRRECNVCHKRFTTYERVQNDPVAAYNEDMDEAEKRVARAVIDLLRARTGLA